MKQYMLYLLRWQLSTPVLWICLQILNFDNLTNTMVANLIGGMIFYWIDKIIFRKK